MEIIFEKKENRHETKRKLRFAFGCGEEVESRTSTEEGLLDSNQKAPFSRQQQMNKSNQQNQYGKKKKTRNGMRSLTLKARVGLKSHHL